MAFPTARTRALARLARLPFDTEDFSLPAGAPTAAELPARDELPLDMAGEDAARMPAGAPELEERQGPSEYERLQAQARRGTLAADIGRAGAMAAEAISGARAPMELYEGLEKRAGGPVREYAERLKHKEAAQKAEQEAALRDPFSAESQRRQAAFSRANPTLANRLGLNSTPYAWADLEAVVKGTMPADTLAARARDQEQREKDLELKAQAEQRRAGTEEKSLDLRAKELAQRMGLDWTKLGLDRQKMLLDYTLEQARAEREAKAAAAKAEKDAKGQTIPAGEAAAIGTTEAALDALDELDAAHETMAGGLTGGIGSMLPGTDASKYDDKVLATAQAVGTILEGGKLAAGDEVKYRKMLPAAGDSAARRKAKIANMKRLLLEHRRTKVKALGDAGYNVSGFRTPAAQALPKDASGQPTLDTPPPKPFIPRRKTDKQGRIWEEQPDGTARLVK